jgi:hypothetical protein
MVFEEQKKHLLLVLLFLQYVYATVKRSRVLGVPVPEGLPGPEGPPGPSSAPDWSEFPATQDVDFDCNGLTSVRDISFCDGSFIGPGSSFDIAANDVLVMSGVQDPDGSYNGAAIVSQDRIY